MQPPAPPKANAFLADIDRYVGGKSTLDYDGEIIKLSSNENPYGPSPDALEAFHASTRLARYPEDGALGLREALGEAHGFPVDQLICGAGSDDIIRMLCHAYAAPGAAVIHSAHGFAMYRIYAKQYGAETISVAEQGLRADVDALLKAVTPQTKLLFLANPNNPTGSVLPAREIHRLRAGLRGDVILALDGAYGEYLRAEDAYSDGRELVADSNTVVFHTFSKAYGLASLRIGWAYGPKAIIDTLYKVRSPFNLSQPALNAAIAALRDATYLREHVARNHREREALARELAALGFTVHPSAANFVLIECADAPGRSAADLNRFLQRHGLIVREVDGYGLPHCLRISIGTEAQNRRLLEVVRDWAA